MTISGQGPSKGFRVSPRTILEIRTIALQTRQVMGVNDNFFSPEDALERLTRYGITVDVIADCEPDLPTGVEACWIPDVATLAIRESVYRAACNREPRALFTTAHEFGHLVLAHRRTFNRDNGGVFKSYQDSEWQANTFAAEFLMPLELIKRYGAYSISALEQLFGVSSLAADIRLQKLRDRHEID